jgi:hypothetical protein
MLAHLAMHKDSGLPLVLAVAAAYAHEAAGALPAAEAPPWHLGPLALQCGFHLPPELTIQQNPHMRASSQWTQDSLLPCGDNIVVPEETR